MSRYLSVFILISFLAAIYSPLIVVICLSFNSSTLVTEWREFTFQWYQAAASDSALRATVANSIYVAIGATTVSLLLGTTAAFAIQHSMDSTMIVDASLRVPLLVPDVAMAVALGMFFQLFSFGHSLTSVIMSHSGWGLSIVYLVVRSNLASVPPGLGLAGSDCGANAWQIAVHIYLPLVVPGVIGGGLLVLALSLGDFTYALFTSGPGSTTLPVFLYSSLRFRFTPVVYSAFTVLFVSTLSLFAVSIISLRGTLAKLSTSQVDPT